MLVRHGGALVRVHAVHLKISPTNIPRENKEDESNRSAVVQKEVQSIVRDTPIKPPVYEDEEDSEDVHQQGRDEAIQDEPNQSAPCGVRGSVANTFRIGDRVQGTHKDTGELVSGTIVSRTGKARGKYKNHYNIKKSDGSID